MKEFERFAVLAFLTDSLNAHGSWCGETHVQKSVYFLQELFGVPTGFEFILYKHGPFSFDLRDELTGMRAEGFLNFIPQPPYGGSHVTSDLGKKLERQFAASIEKHRGPIEYVATNLGPKKVTELEQFATALYVMRQEPNGSRERWAQLVNQLKPHVPVSDAKSALDAVSKIEADIR